MRTVVGGVLGSSESGKALTMYRLSRMWLFLSVSAMFISAEQQTITDDNWKRDLYTNRTLRLDQDPLHVAYASRRRDALSVAASKPNCTGEDLHLGDSTCELVHSHCCQDVYDCELCQLLKGYQTVDAIEILSEIIKILEMQEDLLTNTCSDFSENIETTCVITPYSWKL